MAAQPIVVTKKSLVRETLASIIAGSLHAFVEQPVTTPIEASITQTQINGKGFCTNFADLFRKRALYRALPTALVGAVPKACIHYAILNGYINALAPNGDIKNASTSQATMIGMAAGASEVIFVNPILFVKFRMQRPEWGYKGMIDCIRTVAKTEGARAFWRGAGSIFFRNSICNGGMVGGYKLFEKHLLPRQIRGQKRHTVAGACGGLLGSFVSYPFEMLRAARMHKVSFYDEMLSKGFRRMLAGWFPGACRLILSSAIMGSIIPHLRSAADAMVFTDSERAARKAKAQAQKRPGQR